MYLKILVYNQNVLYERGEQFEVAVSLNHDIMTSFGLHKWIQNPKSEPSCGYNCVSLLLYAYGQHVNVVTHCVRLIWMWEAV